MRGLLIIFIVTACLASCSSFKNGPKYEFSDRYYRLKQNGSVVQKVYVHEEDDSIKIYSTDKSSLSIAPGSTARFNRASFDLDAITEPFKYRPSASNFPRQLNSSFNGNVYAGYRMDYFSLRYLNLPEGTRRKLSHFAFTVGAFGGIGSEPVTPWTTNYQTTDEYSGVVLSRGLAGMIGVNNLTVGIGVGWDRLTDRDKNIWIYQNKPWYGLVIGLNVN